MLTAMMLRAQRAIVRRFEEAGATSTESARGAEELKLTPGIAWYQLVERGVLRCPGEGRYFLDRERWEQVSSQRRHLCRPPRQRPISTASIVPPATSMPRAG